MCHPSYESMSSGPPPSLSARRYQPWHQISDPAERKLAVIRLLSLGWSITSIAEYMQTTRPTIYETLRRWVEEGVAGLDAKPKTNKGVRKVTLHVRNEIRKLQENPRLGRVSCPYRALARGHRGQSRDVRSHHGGEPAGLRAGETEAPRARQAGDALEAR